MKITAMSLTVIVYLFGAVDGTRIPAIFPFRSEEPLQRVRAVAEEALREGSRDRRGDALPSEDSSDQSHRCGRIVHSAEYDRHSLSLAAFENYDLAEY